MKKQKNNSKKKIRIKEIKKLRIEDIKKQKEEVEIKKETLEEHIEDSEIMEDNEFHQFLNSPPSQNISPVLEKIQGEEETDLESNIISSPLSRTTQPEGVATNYSASQNYMGNNYNETGRGYAQIESVSPVLERTRISENIQKQELLNWQDVQAREHSFVENRERVSIRNVEERRTLPFERTEKKYKEFRR